ARVLTCPEQSSTRRPRFISPSNNFKVLQWFDPAAFAPEYLPGTTIPTWGTLGHNALRGPGRDNWNIAMYKTFAAGERLHFELRAESFNTWNHTQFNGVSTAVLRHRRFPELARSLRLSTHVCSNWERR